MTVWILLLIVLLGILGFGLSNKDGTPTNMYIPADSSQVDDATEIAPPITRYLSEPDAQSDTGQENKQGPLQVYRWQNDEGGWALSNTPPEDDRPYQMVDYSGEQLLSAPDQTRAN